ncbi:DNA methyltransferase [Paenisporosarcina quisquiliarum]|uniref:DNA methyltransferase n=1 Tax=Paenisporosarcina quisquiliarum TaxID=365346 RepID=UPI003735E3DB
MNKELQNLLLSQEEYVVEGTLNKNLVGQLARNYDAGLLNALQSNEKIKCHFFALTEGGLIFKLEVFLQFLNNKAFLPDSYTIYKQKIGLANMGEVDLLSQNKQIVLNWPYKDCILEGGQHKEDAKRDELFFNEVLSPTEVTRLMEPKAFSNFVLHDSTGVSKLEKISGDENLIIKGNNLLALSSLKEKFAGKIKLIYIDPPYYFNANKSEDTFRYNSNFKLSTWLVFMKNRLELAKQLLAEDGAIFAQISDDGVAELHLLMKEIFNTPTTNNFINKITVKTKSPSGFQSVNPGVFETAEYIIGFAKNKSKWTYNRQYVEADYDANYKWVVTNIDEDFKNWNIVDIKEVIANDLGLTLENFKKKYDGKLILGLMAEYALKNPDKVFRPVAISNKAGAQIKKVRDESKLSPHEIFLVRREGQYDVYVNKGQELAFYKKKIRYINGEMVPSVQATNMWTDTPYEGIASEGGVVLKGGKKPEKLLKRIIEMGTDSENDIVMDFFLGSGTTCAVAHKLGRRYIGVEQLDYIDELAIPRLESVINGDQSGISKIQGWTGGGSFVYFEIKNDAKEFVDRIEEASDNSELLELFELAKKSSFISYRVDPKKMKSSEFEKLSFAEQKQLLREIIDNNNLYVNYSDIEDQSYGISDEDKVLNRQFYGGGE